jgi:hypothetical protein
MKMKQSDEPSPDENDQTWSNMINMIKNIKMKTTWSTITLWLFNIAMENGSFIDGLPLTNGDVPWLC